MTTFGIKYHLNANFYHYIKMFLVAPPAIWAFLGAWTFGNSYYVSTNNIYTDIVVEPTGSSYVNHRGQTLYEQPIISNQNLPLDVANTSSYRQQFVLRTAESPFYRFLAYQLIGYGVVIAIS